MKKNVYNILHVDDSQTIYKFLQEILDKEKYNISAHYTTDDALQKIKTRHFDLLICNVHLPTIENGLEIIKSFRKQNHDSKILCLTARLTTEIAVRCMQMGADDIISKSAFKLELGNRINFLIKEKALDQPEIGKFKIEHEYAAPENVFIGKSSKISSLKNRLNKILIYEPDIILLEGETGVGKDLLARIVHQKSSRRRQPFVQLNCAAFPETLIESELFGYEKGSFTSAAHSAPGKFEIANRGVLFLDEIGDMPLSLQPKLLQVLDNKSFYRIGGKNLIRVDVLIIAASNQSLTNLVNAKKFREDLFFRLSKIRITIPPLREHKDDIPILIHHFVSQWNCNSDSNIEISKGAMKKMMNYDYPGNVRELKNSIENALMFCDDGILTEDDIQFYFDGSHHSEMSLNKESIIEILKQHHGNISETSTAIGMTREGLSKKIKRMGIDKNLLKT